METVSFISFLDTVAATHDKNRFQSDSVVTTRHCRAAYVSTNTFDCMWSEKTGRVACCRVVSSMCELALTES